MSRGIQVVMYIDRVPNRNSPPAILLRESYRENGKVKKRTLANLSKLPADVIEHIRQGISGSAGNNTQTVCGAIFGVLFVLKEIARQSGVERALGSSRIGKLVLFLVLARIAHQGSRLSAVRWARDHAVEAVLGLKEFDEDDLYEALDWVASQQESIEKCLYRDYVKRAGQAPNLVLYDVTSSYFEGMHNELGEYGYNRDGKRGKKQIVIGLLTAPDGEPLAVEVFVGNTSDPYTVKSQIDKLIQRFGVEEVVMVGDRGMIKSAQKQALKEVDFRYITALTDPQIRKLLKKSIIQLGLFDNHVMEVEHNDKRLVLRCDAITKRKESHRREDKLARLRLLVDERNSFVEGSLRANPEAGLRRLQKWARRHKLSKFVELGLDGRKLYLQIDELDMQDAALLDGCYCIETDVSRDHLSAEQVHERYRDLQQVEQNFRRLKTGLLEIRPIFVRKADRTRAHVFIAMLSLKISRHIDQRLHAAFGTTDTNSEAETLDSVLSALSRFSLQHYTLGEQNFTGLPRPDNRQQSILAALGVTLKPSKHL